MKFIPKNGQHACIGMYMPKNDQRCYVNGVVHPYGVSPKNIGVRDRGGGGNCPLKFWKTMEIRANAKKIKKIREDLSENRLIKFT
jgi:hypothetical protein